MNRLTRTWLTLRHQGKFARRGVHCRFPIPDLHVVGHVEVGDYCRFRNNVTLRTLGDGKIIFGNRSGLSWGCYAEASQLIRIGNYTGVAEYSVLCDTVIEFAGTDADWRHAPRHSAPIVIGDNCFVGSGCFIGPGVSIGEGAIVAHHSVVTRDIGPYEIWGGMPARRLGHRTEGVPETKLQESRELVAKHGIQRDRYQR